MSKSTPQIADDRQSMQGAILLLVTLGVFFFSSLILYAIYVLLRLEPNVGEIIPFFLPRGFLLTTVILVSISILLQMAVGAVRQERQADFSRYVVIAFLLAIAFMISQSIALMWMVNQLIQPHQSTVNLYGLTMALVMVHALHVIGGVAGIVHLLFGIFRKSYDHERHFPVRFCAIYWHFLDVVWVLMLGCFGLAAWISKTYT